MTLATISFQNYFRLYKTIWHDRYGIYRGREFQQIYSLDVIQVPPNCTIARVDHEDLIFKSEAGKLKAVAEAIKEYHKAGRPVLVAVRLLLKTS